MSGDVAALRLDEDRMTVRRGREPVTLDDVPAAQRNRDIAESEL
jgi:hypothetical protein